MAGGAVAGGAVAGGVVTGGVEVVVVLEVLLDVEVDVVSGSELVVGARMNSPATRGCEPSGAVSLAEITSSTAIRPTRSGTAANNRCSRSRSHRHRDTDRGYR